MLLRADETIHTRLSHLSSRPSAVIDLTDRRAHEPRPGVPGTTRARRRSDGACEVRHAQQWQVQWLVPLDRAATIAAEHGLHPVAVLPGRGRLTIAFTRVLDSDRGRYRELRATLSVNRHDQPPTFRAGQLLDPSGEAHAELLLASMVDTSGPGDTTRRPGAAESARVEIAPQGNQTAATCAAESGHQLTLTVHSGGPLPLSVATPPTYLPDANGTLHMTTWELIRARGGRRPAGAHLVLGRHGQLPALLRSLGLPKRPLLSANVDDLHARFAAARHIG